MRLLVEIRLPPVTEVALFQLRQLAAMLFTSQSGDSANVLVHVLVLCFNFFTHLK